MTSPTCYISRVEGGVGCHIVRDVHGLWVPGRRPFSIRVGVRYLPLLLLYLLTCLALLMMTPLTFTTSFTSPPYPPHQHS